MTIGFIETHNFVSYRASRRLGSRTAGYTGYLRRLGKTFTFRSPGAKKHQFRFHLPQPGSTAGN
jgi:hypothetical protein